jgi:hypothetical protein
MSSFLAIISFKVAGLRVFWGYRVAGYRVAGYRVAGSVGGCRLVKIKACSTCGFIRLFPASGFGGANLREILTKSLISKLGILETVLETVS